MMIASALLAFSVIASQGGAPQSFGTVTLGSRVVSITYPSLPVPQIPEEIKTWDGWIGLESTRTEWPTPFSQTGNWSSVASKLAELGPTPAGTPVWKTKIVLITQGDFLEKRNGLFLQNRSKLTDTQVDAVTKAVARLSGYARVLTNNAISPSIDFTIEPEAIQFDEQGASGDWLKNYLSGRFNRGSFEAEDKQFRGPYQSVIVLHPGYSQGTTFTDVKGQEVTSVSVFHDWAGTGEVTGLEQELSQVLAYQAWLRKSAMGIYEKPTGGGQSSHLPSLQTLWPDATWALILDSGTPTIGAITSLYALAGKTLPDPATYFENEITRQSSISQNVALTVTPDTERGNVLRFAESGSARRGGFALPFQKVDVTKTPFLTFWMKSTSRDPLTLWVEDKSSLASYPVQKALNAPNDGAWHQVSVDLKGTQRTEVQSLYLGAGPWDVSAERSSLGEIVYQFDDFKFSATAEGTPVGNAVPTADETRAKTAGTMSAADLAKDGSDLVRLNGLLSRSTPFVAADEAGLIELTKSVNGRIASAAVNELAKLNTQTGRVEILRLMASSPFEPTKRAAALQIGVMADEKLAGAVSRLFASRSWQTRLAAGRAVTMIPGEEPAVISMTFLQETDPQVRLTVTENANIQNAVVIKRLLWSAVNDPSDSVRAASCWRLIQSGKAKEVAEGYKGIRDDSIRVRLELLERMIAAPNEGHRGALRIAVTDLSPSVRAAALRAFSKLTEPVSIDEISNVMEDKFPLVQLALLDLAKAKSLTLPANAITSLKESIDPRVVERAKELGL